MTPRILIVEDSRTQLLRTQLLLQKKGYEVLTAHDGREGLQTAIQEMPDLVITDINMPEMDGYELCRRLKGIPKTRSIPVLLLTAQDELEDISRGLAVGANGFLPKPFDAEDLYERVEDLLNTPSADQGNRGILLDRNRIRILQSILESYSSQSSSDVIGVLVFNDVQKKGICFILSILPLAKPLVEQFFNRLQEQFEKERGLRLSGDQIEKEVLFKETELPEVVEPFKLFMELPILVRGRVVGMLGAVSTANALRTQDVKLFHEFCQASAEAFGHIVGLHQREVSESS